MKAKKMYYYAFYRFYKMAAFFEMSKLNKVQAMFSLSLLELSIGFSLINYYDIIFNRPYNGAPFLSSAVLLIFIFVKDERLFFKTEIWREYFDEFDNWSKAKSTKGGWIVFGTALLIVGNFMLSLIWSSR